MEEQVETFKECLNFIINNDHARIREKFSPFFATTMGQRYVTFAEQWKMLQKLSTMIFTFISPEDLRNDIVLINIDTIILAYQNILTNNQVNVFLSSSFRSMEEILNQLSRLGYFENNTEFRRELFKGYVDMASAIRSDPIFNSTIMGGFEQLITDPYQCILNHVAPSGRPSNFSRRSVEKSTIALVCPSFCGKTQSAFVLSNVKPLYFPLGQSFTGITQGVYRNFESLSKTIEELAFKDLCMLKFSFPEEVLEIVPNSPRVGMKVNPEPIYEAMNDHRLATDFRNFKFLTLGFLEELVNRARTHLTIPTTSDRPWMEYWATQGSFSFEARSIADLKKEESDNGSPVFKGFCLFLDEYVGFVELILLKNLAIAADLRCIVANTNSDISNLIGLRHGPPKSKIMATNIWSIVVTTLGSLSTFVFSKMNTQSAYTLYESLRSRCSAPVAFDEFFINFLYDQRHNLRPGCFTSILDIIKLSDETLTSEFSFCEWLDFVVGEFSRTILKRKRTIDSELTGQIGNFLLFLENAYKSESVSDKLLNSSKEIIVNHLYYLVNPVDEGEWLFLTMPADDTNEYLAINKGYRRKSWDIVTARFSADEILVILGCLALNINSSVGASVTQRPIVPRTSLSNVPNLSALKRDGNALEVHTAVSLVDASHHAFNSDICTFDGQDGVNFIQNLVRNLLDINGKQMTTSPGFAPLTFSQNHARIFNLEAFLSESIVPYLMPANLPIPKILEKMSFMHDVINVGACARLADNVELDLEFDIYPDSTFLAPGPAKSLAVIECKNWSNALDYSNLRIIMDKAIRPEVCMSILVCTRVNVPPKASMKAFCTSRKMNMYSLNNRNELEIFRRTVPIEKPKMVYIIIELERLGL